MLEKNIGSRGHNVSKKFYSGRVFGKLSIVRRGPDYVCRGYLFPRYYVKCLICKRVKLSPSSGFTNNKLGCQSCSEGAGARKHGQCKSPEYIMLYETKRRAKERGIAFNLSIHDIFIPKICPLLSIEMKRAKIFLKDNSPSLDRIDPARGYVPGNVWVVSYKANRIKSNATLNELKIIVKNLNKRMKRNKKWKKTTK